MELYGAYMMLHVRSERADIVHIRSERLIRYPIRDAGALRPQAGHGPILRSRRKWRFAPGGAS